VARTGDTLQSQTYEKILAGNLSIYGISGRISNKQEVAVWTGLNNGPRQWPVDDSG
jgi:hypothetical protein